MWSSLRILSLSVARTTPTRTGACAPPIHPQRVEALQRLQQAELELETLGACGRLRPYSTSRLLLTNARPVQPVPNSLQGPPAAVTVTGTCMMTTWTRGAGAANVMVVPQRTFVGISGARWRKTVFTPEKSSSPDEEENLVKGDKVMKLNLNSTRLDGVLKAGLQISKNKIEKMFFADRIRVNGERPKKKSQTMREGDEIDIMHKSNAVNPDFIDVSRIEIMQLGEEVEDDDEDMIDDKKSDDDEDYRIPAVLKRYKRLTVENYKQKWKGPVE